VYGEGIKKPESLVIVPQYK